MQIDKSRATTASVNIILLSLVDCNECYILSLRGRNVAAQVEKSENILVCHLSPNMYAIKNVKAKHATLTLFTFPTSGDSAKTVVLLTGSWCTDAGIIITLSVFVFVKFEILLYLLFTVDVLASSSSCPDNHVPVVFL